MWGWGVPGSVLLGLWAEDIEWMLYLDECSSGKSDDPLDQNLNLIYWENVSKPWFIYCCFRFKTLVFTGISV